MNDRETIDYDPAEALLQEGRSELSKGNFDKARWYFEQVLVRRPDDARALLGMSYITRQTEPPPDGGDAVLGAQTQIVELVREKRYEEALDVLRREALTQPDNTTIAKSVAHLETHLLRRRLRTLGGPEATWVPTPDAPDTPVVALLDGRRPIREVIERSSAGRDETLRQLVVLLDEELIRRAGDGGDFGPDSNGDGEPDDSNVDPSGQRVGEAPTGEGPALRDPDDVPRIVRADTRVRPPSLDVDRRALGSVPDTSAMSGAPVAGRLLALLVLIAVLVAVAYVALYAPAHGG